MINWPRALVCELAERRCIIFLGAGASAGCLGSNGKVRPPTWESLLQDLLGKMQRAEERIIAQDLISTKKYLDAAEVIYSDVPAADLTQYLRETFLLPRFAPSAVHETVLKLDPKVTITTNFDDVYDNYCRQGDASAGYNVVRYYESHLVSDLRSPVRLIVKAHGCISNPSLIVLTRSQYFEQRRTHSQFFKVLDALFLSSSLLFIGYSLSDPDIQLVLENANIAAPKSHPHYAVVPDDVHSAIRRSWERSYNIEFLSYPAGQYSDLNESLVDLHKLVTSFRANHLA